MVIINQNINFLPSFLLSLNWLGIAPYQLRVWFGIFTLPFLPCWCGFVPRTLLKLDFQSIFSLLGLVKANLQKRMINNRGKQYFLF
jgi:hypothetical protein